MSNSRGASNMATEIATIPALAKKLLEDRQDLAAQIGGQLRAREPHVVTTIARGSSDHAATYMKYVIEMLMGIPVASTGPSINSVYGASMKLKNAATIAVSQSGQSPDILAMSEAAKSGGSLVISVTNNDRSPLSKISDFNFDIGAHKELSLAATKTFVLSVVSGLMIIANWSGDKALLAALEALPDDLEKAFGINWNPLADHIASNGDKSQSLFVLGRGPSFAIASECALKFKETCQMHGEAYSAAEVLHGPSAIAAKGFTVLALAPQDASQKSVFASAEQLQKQGAKVFVAAPGITAGLAAVQSAYPLTAPLVQVVTFYNFIEHLARRLGLDPDKPPHLNKVTSTM